MRILSSLESGRWDDRNLENLPLGPRLRTPNARQATAVGQILETERRSCEPQGRMWGERSVGRESGEPPPDTDYIAALASSGPPRHPVSTGTKGSCLADF